MKNQQREVKAALEQALVIDVAVTYVDLRALGNEAKVAELKRLKAEVASAPFDLAKGPLFRFVLLQSDFPTFFANSVMVSLGTALAVTVVARKGEATTRLTLTGEGVAAS